MRVANFHISKDRLYAEVSLDREELALRTDAREDEYRPPGAGSRDLFTGICGSRLILQWPRKVAIWILRSGPHSWRDKALRLQRAEEIRHRCLRRAAQRPVIY